MSSYKYIEARRENTAGVVVLDNPPNNRLTVPMMHEVLAAVQKFDDDPLVRAILIGGKGKDFGHGGDVESILACGNEWEANQFYFTVVKVAKALRSCTKPTIAVVHGQTTSGNMVVAMNCDLVVASDDTVMGATAIDFGLLCPWGPISIMPRIVGPKRAFELGVTGELVTADVLLQHHVINKVVPRSELDAAAMEMVSNIAKKSPTAIMLHKRGFYTAQDMDYEKALDYGAALMVQYHMTPEAKEGMSAFLQQRDAEWSVSGYTSDFSVVRDTDASSGDGVHLESERAG